MTKNLTTIIEEILPKELEFDGNTSETDNILFTDPTAVDGYNQAISDIRNKIPQLVEEIVDEIKKVNVTYHERSENRDDSYDDSFDDGTEIMQGKIIKSLTGKNI